jgi:hypothetical protein
MNPFLTKTRSTNNNTGYHSQFISNPHFGTCRTIREASIPLPKRKGHCIELYNNLTRIIGMPLSRADSSFPRWQEYVYPLMCNAEELIPQKTITKIGCYL